MGKCYNEIFKEIPNDPQGDEFPIMPTNGKVERLNGVMDSMIGKYLLGKPTTLSDLYLKSSIIRLLCTDTYLQKPLLSILLMVNNLTYSETQIK